MSNYTHGNLDCILWKNTGKSATWLILAIFCFVFIFVLSEIYKWNLFFLPSFLPSSLPCFFLFLLLLLTVIKKRKDSANQSQGLIESWIVHERTRAPCSQAYECECVGVDCGNEWAGPETLQAPFPPWGEKALTLMLILSRQHRPTVLVPFTFLLCALLQVFRPVFLTCSCHLYLSSSPILPHLSLLWF